MREAEAMGLQITTTPEFLGALDAAGSIALSAYTLRAGAENSEQVIAALERAGDRGAHVYVRLEGAPYDPGGSGGLARQNLDTIAALRRHGVNAVASSDPQAPLHLKAAVVDGRAFLDDRNWPGTGANTIVTTADPDDVAAVTAALDGRHGADGHLATWKWRAQQLELDTLRYSPAHAIDFESESFGAGRLSALLEQRARAGDSVRLLVAGRDLAGNSREAAALAQLAAAGVEVRVGAAGQGELDEKMCITGNSAWVGSANATAGFPETADWGMRTRVAPVVDALRARFEQNWSGAQRYPLS
jgi:phosphatidylserine/phosphatidylglycerophosphate/cardiolipin synthase-like enzyme